MATGDLLCAWSPEQGSATALTANSASLNFIVGASADNPDQIYWVADFDPGSSNNEALDFFGYMPAHYGGGNVTIKIAWSVASTSVNVKWDGQFKSITDDTEAATALAFASEQTSGAVGAGSAANEIVVDTITFTSAQIDGLVADEFFYFRLTRDSADALDTANSDDARVYGIAMIDG